MIGHLGSRVTALLDGRLPAAEEERVWDHVHSCHPCRDAVEREGWVKTQLAQWGSLDTPGTDSLRDSLLAQPLGSSLTATAQPFTSPAGVAAAPTASMRARHMVAVGGSALGVAMLGVMALGAVPANAPLPDRRTASTSVVPPSFAPPLAPTSSPGARAGISQAVMRPADVRVLVRHGNMVP